MTLALRALDSREWEWSPACVKSCNMSQLESQEGSYWLERWEKGMTGWHKDSVDQILQVDLVVDRERLSKAEASLAMS